MWHLFAKLFGLKNKISIPNIERINLKPGDKLVVTIDQRLSVYQYERIRAEFERVFTGTPKTPIIILDGGLKLSVIHREEVQSNERDTKDLPPEGTTPDET